MPIGLTFRKSQQKILLVVGKHKTLKGLLIPSNIADSINAEFGPLFPSQKESSHIRCAKKQLLLGKRYMLLILLALLDGGRVSVYILLGLCLARCTSSRR